jgi:TnpA family transposase
MKPCNIVSMNNSKIPAEENTLNATILAQALNNGNFMMSEICDIPYDKLLDTYQSRLRLQTMQKANDIISNDIANMPIFPDYSLDLTLLYAGVDGQKYEVERPTLKARRSKKYFKKGKGVVAYTMLSNHIPLQSEVIGAHEHESYYAFDIWYNNTTNIAPHVLTGDMHLINKANFALMDWFGGKLYPRFTNLQAQTKHLYCSDDLKNYGNQIICPVGQINRQLIEEEWPNIRRIIAALGLKEISQSILMKKLCTYTTDSRTRKAIFEYDKLIRSIYTLKYFQDRTMQRDIHRSRNRIEAYHQLRAVIASAYGKKQLMGKSDREVEISNQCGRMIANAIIHYNSAILSRLKVKYEAEGNHKALAILKKISPVAWQHIHFQGHFVFSSNAKIIDLEAMVSKVVLQRRK